MRYADLHADTPYRMFFEHLSFDSPVLHISRPLLKNYEHAIQVFAFFCENSHDDETVYDDFLSMHDMFTHVLENNPLPDFNPLFSVEDGRLLNGKLERLFELQKRGVRILTPLWKNDTCIGGAYNTENGLTPFGKEAVRAACELGILPDISHASPQSADDILTIANDQRLPCLATHSNAFSVLAHPRNLRSCHMEAVRDGGGLIGISFASPHLTMEGVASTDDILRHIYYYLENGCENCLALGCDFDGIGKTPTDLPNVAALPHLKDTLLANGFTDMLANKILYKNATDFFVRCGLLQPM